MVVVVSVPLLVLVPTRLDILAVASGRIVIGEVALHNKNVRILTFEKLKMNTTINISH